MKPSVPLPIGRSPDRDGSVELEAPGGEPDRVGVGEAAVDGDEVVVAQEVGADVGLDLEGRGTEAHPECDVVEVHALGKGYPPAEVAEVCPQLGDLSVRHPAEGSELQSARQLDLGVGIPAVRVGVSAALDERLVAAGLGEQRRVAAERRRVAGGRRQTARGDIGEADAVDLHLAQPDVLGLELETVVVDAGVVDAQRGGARDTAELGVRPGGERRGQLDAQREVGVVGAARVLPELEGDRTAYLQSGQHGAGGHGEGLAGQDLLLTRTAVGQRPVDAA